LELLQKRSPLRVSRPALDCDQEAIMKRTNTFLPEPLIERLKQRAKQTDLTVSELIRRAIEQFLKKPN
jgi:predicted DNA binding CopG/RHH family protein